MQNCRNSNRVSNRMNYNSIEYMPLAMAYVPWQRWNTIYEPEKALMIGTVFPELNKPFGCIKGGCRQ